MTHEQQASFEPPREPLAPREGLSLTSIGLTRRALRESYYVANSLRGNPVDPELPQELSILENYIVRITSQTAMKHLPRPGQTDWQPNSELEYFSFNAERKTIEPTVKVIEKEIEDANLYVNAKQVQNSIHQFFELGGLIRPVVGDVTELIKMYGNARDMAVETADTTLTDDELDHAVAQIYLNDDSYEALQKRYYEKPENMYAAGSKTLGEITGRTMTKVNFFMQQGYLPDEEQTEAYYSQERDDMQARAQIKNRSSVLNGRILRLWFF